MAAHYELTACLTGTLLAIWGFPHRANSLRRYTVPQRWNIMLSGVDHKTALMGLIMRTRIVSSCDTEITTEVSLVTCISHVCNNFIFHLS